MKGPGYARAMVVSMDASRCEVLVLVLVSVDACSFGFQSGSALADSPLTGAPRHRAAPLKRPSGSHSGKNCLAQQPHSACPSLSTTSVLVLAWVSASPDQGSLLVAVPSS